jgi:hypothetical protein
MFVHIIENNIKTLVKLDRVMETDVKNEMRKFNPERNEEMIRKFMNSNEILIPTREKRVENMLDNFMELYKVKLY